ncbi:uncharacterized protein LOC144353430 [Saccoglossus kowalevskii]
MSDNLGSRDLCYTYSEKGAVYKLACTCRKPPPFLLPLPPGMHPPPEEPKTDLSNLGTQDILLVTIVVVVVFLIILVISLRLLKLTCNRRSGETGEPGKRKKVNLHKLADQVDDESKRHNKEIQLVVI